MYNILYILPPCKQGLRTPMTIHIQNFLYLSLITLLQYYLFLKTTINLQFLFECYQ